MTLNSKTCGILILTYFYLNFAEKVNQLGVKVEIRTFRCQRNSDFVTHVTCKMIPTKNKCYNLSIHGNIKNPIHDVFVQGTVYFFYQGSFRRFIFDVDWNYCGFFKGSLTSFFMAKAAKQFNKNFPNLVHPCPYSGIVFLPNFDPAVLVDGVAPKFIPDGLYKLTVRFHTPNNNVTMLLIEATGAMTILKKKGKSDLNTTLSLFL